MNIKDLFAGVGVVVDDKVFSSNEREDRIVSIVKELEDSLKFPLVKYADLPDEEILSKLNSASFFLLDWEIDPRETALGEDGLNVHLGSEFKTSQEKRVIEAVHSILKASLIPVFIFSNQDTDSIKKKLTDAGVDLSKRQIFIKPKSDFGETGTMLEAIEKWVDDTSGVYVAKCWEQAFCKAKNNFFAEMANNTSHWPKALFCAADEDCVNPGEEISQAISQNIISRMLPIDISQEQIDKDTDKPDKEEVLSIMKGQFFLENISDASIVGDFYKKRSGEFYVNIRPTCDCIEGRKNNDGLIYLLECCRLGEGQVKKQYSDGHFTETIDCAVVGPLFEKKFYRIKFKKVIVGNHSEWKEKKTGRILPPIINHVAERYSLYIQRQALPRIPSEIIPDVSKEVDAHLEDECDSLLESSCSRFCSNFKKFFRK